MYRLVLILLVILTACKSENKPDKPQIKPLSLAEKIANAHGFKNWDKVSEIQFTFNVDKDSTHFERSWIWRPKTSAVTMITKKDTISYYTNAVDSSNINADKEFINDKYWALFPFQLVWDKGAHLSQSEKAEAPISKIMLNKTTLTYTNAGGYTPGDAYDIFYDDNYSIKEWIFREANKKETSLSNTFENYQTFNGITIATDHKKEAGHWNLNFNNIVVITNN